MASESRSVVSLETCNIIQPFTCINNLAVRLFLIYVLYIQAVRLNFDVFVIHRLLKKRGVFAYFKDQTMPVLPCCKSLSYASSYRIFIISFSSSCVIPRDFAVCIISAIFCSTSLRFESLKRSTFLVETKVPIPT